MKANENPFRSGRIETIRYDLIQDCIKELANKALDLGISSLVGPKGTGKTTLLEDLEPHFIERNKVVHHIRLNLDSSQKECRLAIHKLQTLNGNDVCLFDGAEILSIWHWLRVRRIASKGDFCLVATLHKRDRISVLLETFPSWELTGALVKQLSAEHYSTSLLEHARASFDANNGNMREVFCDCYIYLANHNA